MADPATGAVGAAAAVGLASLMPWVDANALMGACLGAGLVAYNKEDMAPLMRLGALIFSALVGYFFADEIVSQTFITETGVSAFVGAIAIVPLAMKLTIAVEKVDLHDVLKKWRGG